MKNENTILPDICETYPIVYAVRKRYVIIVPVNCETLMWVRVGDNNYYDDANGILRSRLTTHKMEVPMEELDREKKYTLCYRKVIERLPYYSKVTEVFEASFEFTPAPADNIRIYMIADSHNLVETPVKAASYFENPDILVLNGDVPNHCGKIEYLTTIHKIASEITKGSIPVIFSRGNHDARGIYAEFMGDHTPTDNGKSYFTFRMGSLWGIVLDCAEDKRDDSDEYGNTICCADFRKKETEFIKEVIMNADHEYLEEGVKYRIAISHNPFVMSYPFPFDIENDTYEEWTKLLNEHIKPCFMMCGHTHRLKVIYPGDETDNIKKSTFPVITASKADKKSGYFAGGSFVFEGDNVKVTFNDCEGEILGETYIRVD